jgi:hypothetical protein
MRTKNLPLKIESVEEAKAFLSLLHRNGEAPKQSHDKDWENVNTTKKERVQLNKLMKDIYNLQDYFDPGGFVFDLDMEETKRFLGWEPGADTGPGWKD